LFHQTVSFAFSAAAASPARLGPMKANTRQRTRIQWIRRRKKLFLPMVPPPFSIVRKKFVFLNWVIFYRFKVDMSILFLRLFGMMKTIDSGENIW
jgi:hypothetical protein